MLRIGRTRLLMVEASPDDELCEVVYRYQVSSITPLT